MKKLIPLLVILISFLNINKPSNEDLVIPNESIRFRIIPADNSADALLDKAKVKDLVKKDIIPLLSTEATLSATRTKINNLMPLIKN